MSLDSRMPFGKHKGRRISDLPPSYLHWLRGLDDLREPLRTVVEHEYRRRFAPPPPPRTDHLALRPPHPEVFRDVVRAGFRAVALKTHPDTGGTTQGMQRVNEVREWAKKQGLVA